MSKSMFQLLVAIGEMFEGWIQMDRHTSLQLPAKARPTCGSIICPEGPGSTFFWKEPLCRACECSEGARNRCLAILRPFAKRFTGQSVSKLSKTLSPSGDVQAVYCPPESSKNIRVFKCSSTGLHRMKQSTVADLLTFTTGPGPLMDLKLGLFLPSSGLMVC